MNKDPRLLQSSTNARKNFYAFREVDKTSPKEEVLSHFHEESECIYVLKGNLSFQINESKQVLREGDVLLILPDTIHRDLIHEEGTQLIRIIVHPAMLTQEPAIRLHFIQPFLDSSKRDPSTCLLPIHWQKKSGIFSARRKKRNIRMIPTGL